MIPMATVKVGDVIGFADRRPFARMIRWAQRLDDGHGRINHVALVSDEAGAGTVTEALCRVRVTPLEAYLDRPCVIYRPVGNGGLTPGERKDLLAAAARAVGDVYGASKLVLNFLDCLTRSYFFTRWFGLLGFKQCANFVGWCYRHAAGRDCVFGVEWRCLRPDVIDRWCWLHPADWTIIHDDIGGTEQLSSHT